MNKYLELNTELGAAKNHNQHILNKLFYAPDKVQIKKYSADSRTCYLSFSGSLADLWDIYLYLYNWNVTSVKYESSQEIENNNLLLKISTKKLFAGLKNITENYFVTRTPSLEPRENVEEISDKLFGSLVSLWWKTLDEDVSLVFLSQKKEVAGYIYFAPSVDIIHNQGVTTE